MWPIIYLGQADSGQSTASVACPFHTWRPRKEYSDGKGGTTWKAMREERPVTPNFDPIRAGHRIRVMLPGLCVALYEGTRVTKTEVNIRHTGRSTCDLKNDPIRASHRPSGTPLCPVAFLEVQMWTKKGSTYSVAGGHTCDPNCLHAPEVA